MSTLKNHAEERGIADATSKTLTPLLIIPGFMSSGLVIQKSPHKSMEGKRLWFNIKAAGFNSLHRGGALVKNEEQHRSNWLLDGASGDGNAGDDGDGVVDQSSEEMHQEYVKQMECKSLWVEHMRLQSDMIHEKEGFESRAIPGTAGVDYLAPGALTGAASYVFGPVLKLLKSEGYIDGVNLDAVPYDWRIPPSVLESRDNYFSNTIKTIERLYKKSNSTPVALLCHSMGCRTGHYLLNFVLHHMGQVDGQAWIDTHIHSYVPVGAPHLGAQKTVRCVIDGDKMGLEAFLDDNEGLMLGRSYGSAQWLFPLEESFDNNNNNSNGVVVDPTTKRTTTPQTTPLPQSVANTTTTDDDDDDDDAIIVTPQSLPMPTAIVRNESSMKIVLPAQSLDLTSFVHHRKRHPPAKLRLAIQVGKDVIVRTDFIDVTTKLGQHGGGNNRLHVNFKDETWLIACPPTIEHTMRLYPYIQLHLEEPGTGSAPKRKKGIFYLDILWPLRCALCILKWTFCLPCAFVWKFGRCVISGAKKGADIGAALLGEFRVIGQSGKVDWKKGVTEHNKKTNGDDGGEEGRGSSLHQVWTEIGTADDERYGFFLKKPTPEKFAIKVKWEPSTLSSALSTVSNVVCHKSHAGKKDATTTKLKMQYDNIRKNNISYISSNSHQLLQMEGLTNALHLLKETYGNDPLGPHSLSAWQAPPVKKVIAIYGINLPTEVSCAYKRNPSVNISNSLDQLFVLDNEAKLNTQNSATHIIKEGVISETKKTPQNIIGEESSSSATNIIQQKSGDGTVPYWSLQHCRSWQGKCDVTVHEIDSAEHREILNDKRFHAILLELLIQPTRRDVVQY